MASGTYLDFDGLQYFYEKLKTYIAEYCDATVYGQVSAKLDAWLEDGTLQTLADTYFADIDLQDEVDNKLDEMLANGELESLLTGTLDNGMFNSSTTISFKRVMRELLPDINNPDYTDSTYDMPQGGTYIGNNLFAQCTIRGTSNQNAQLRIINLTTGETERSVVLPLQHANSITFNPDDNEFYVTSLTYNGSNTQYVYVVNYSTLAITKTIDLSSQLAETEGTHSISYDQVTGKTYLFTEFRTNNANKFYELDVENETVTEIELEDYRGLLSNWYGTNDICVDNNILYVLHHIPDLICKYDLNTRKCLFVYTTEQFIARGVKIGEMESISKDPESSIFYIASTHLDCVDGWYRVVNYLMTSFAQGIDCGNFSVDGFPAVYVDVNATGLNPTGTASNPYKTIGEAIEVLNQEQAYAVEIHIKAGTYPYVGIRQNKRILIRKDGTDATTNYVIRGVKVENGNLELNSVTIKSTGTYDVNALYSDVYVALCVGSNNLVNLNAYKSNAKVLTFKKENNTYADIRCQAESVLNIYDSASNIYSIQNATPTFMRPCRIGNVGSIDSSAYKTIGYSRNSAVVEDTANCELIIETYITSTTGKTIVPVTSRNNNSDCTMGLVIDDTVVKLGIQHNTTAKTIGFKVLSAIKLDAATPTDVTSTFSFNANVLMTNRDK